MPSLRVATLAGSMFQAMAFAAGTAQAQSWGTPNRAFSNYGVKTIVCDERTHDAPCLGLACRDGALALVSASGGGGPMDGPTTVSTGRTRFTLRFQYDARAVDRLGIAASHSDLTLSQFEALVAATSVTVNAKGDPSIRHRFPTRGLASEGRRAAASCR